jgi:hypothetical protein
VYAGCAAFLRVTTKSNLLACAIPGLTQFCARGRVGLRTLDVPAVTRWSSGSHVLRRHGLLPFDGTELVADDREREVECFRGHRLEVLVGCMP